MTYDAVNQILEDNVIPEKYEEFAETSIGERFDFSIKILKEPEVQANLTKDQTFMLTLCSIGLIALLYPQLRFSGKSKISKL